MVLKSAIRCMSTVYGSIKQIAACFNSRSRLVDMSGFTTDNCDYDVVVVGAGITGAAMALSLADCDLRIAIIDGRALTPDPTADNASVELDRVDVGLFDARVSAITAASQRLFESLDVWPAMLAARVSPYMHMHVREADGTASIDFSAADIHAPVLGHILENRVITAAIYQQLLVIENVTVLAPLRVTACTQDKTGAWLSLDNNSTISAGLVIAADGANSPLRGMAGFRTREWTYQHHAIVTTVKTSESHQQTARQIFMDEGVLAFLPLTNGSNDGSHYCSIVWSVVPEQAAVLMQMSDEAFCQALSLASQHWLGPVQSTAQRSSFALIQRHAKNYYRDRVVLIGDAAHSIHPLAGQGANLGLADVRVLAEELHGAMQNRRAIYDPFVLGRYQRRRKGDNLLVMAMMEGFKRLYGPQPLLVRWLRNTGMRAVDSWPLLKNQLIRQAMG